MMFGRSAVAAGMAASRTTAQQAASSRMAVHGSIRATWRCTGGARMKPRLSAATVVALALATAFALHTGARAQEHRSANRLTTDHYMDLERVSDAQIAPDGSRIIYTRQHVNTLEDKWDSELWI